MSGPFAGLFTNSASRKAVEVHEDDDISGDDLDQAGAMKPAPSPAKPSAARFMDVAAEEEGRNGADEDAEDEDEDSPSLQQWRADDDESDESEEVPLPDKKRKSKKRKSSPILVGSDDESSDDGDLQKLAASVRKNKPTPRPEELSPLQRLVQQEAEEAKAEVDRAQKAREKERRRRKRKKEAKRQAEAEAFSGEDTDSDSGGEPTKKKAKKDAKAEDADAGPRDMDEEETAAAFSRWSDMTFEELNDASPYNGLELLILQSQNEQKLEKGDRKLKGNPSAMLEVEVKVKGKAPEKVQPRWEPLKVARAGDQSGLGALPDGKGTAEESLVTVGGVKYQVIYPPAGRKILEAPDVTTLRRDAFSLSSVLAPCTDAYQAPTLGWLKRQYTKKPTADDDNDWRHFANVNGVFYTNNNLVDATVISRIMMYNDHIIAGVQGGKGQPDGRLIIPWSDLAKCGNIDPKTGVPIIPWAVWLHRPKKSKKAKDAAAPAESEPAKKKTTFKRPSPKRGKGQQQLSLAKSKDDPVKNKVKVKAEPAPAAVAPQPKPKAKAQPVNGDPLPVRPGPLSQVAALTLAEFVKDSTRGEDLDGKLKAYISMTVVLEFKKLGHKCLQTGSMSALGSLANVVTLKTPSIQHLVLPMIDCPEDCQAYEKLLAEVKKLHDAIVEQACRQ